MALADRDYMTESSSRPPVGEMHMWTVTTWIIVINVAVFVLDFLLGRAGYAYLVQFPGRPPQVFGFLEFWGHYSIALSVQALQVWRFITFQFLHANISHILFNMLALYFFGPMIEAYLGRRRFVAFYLLSGIGGPIAYGFFWYFRFLNVDSTTPLVGASAGVFGVLVAAARIAPNTTVLIYGSFPAKLKTVAWVMIAIAVFTVFSHGQNAGGEAAHLGGAAVGYLLIARPQWLNVFEIGYRSGRRRFTYR